MKAILEFNLPEDKQDYMQAIKGSDAHLVLYHFTEHFLREKLKYEQDLPEEYTKALEDVSTHLYELIKDYSLAIIGDY